MRDHGGNIDAAKARFGGSDWIDLSTGINRVPYPLPDLPPAAQFDINLRRQLGIEQRAVFHPVAAINAVSGAKRIERKLRPRMPFARQGNRVDHAAEIDDVPPDALPPRGPMQNALSRASESFINRKLREIQASQEAVRA